MPDNLDDADEQMRLRRPPEVSPAMQGLTPSEIAMIKLLPLVRQMRARIVDLEARVTALGG